jgi:hypothetical protein
MRIPSRDVPQADKLKYVLRLVFAVAEGAETYQQLASAISKVGRQGRYYRRAAEILGFTEKEGLNRTVLTTAGWTFVNSVPEMRPKLLKEAVLRTEMIRVVIPFLRSKADVGVTRAELSSFIERNTAPAGPTMMPRRVSTVLSWLTEIGLIRKDRGKYLLIEDNDSR